MCVSKCIKIYDIIILVILCLSVISIISVLSLLFPSQGTSEALEEVGGMLVEKLPVFIQSGDLEVQERACCILQVEKKFDYELHVPQYVNAGSYKWRPLHSFVSVLIAGKLY